MTPAPRPASDHALREGAQAAAAATPDPTPKPAHPSLAAALVAALAELTVVEKGRTANAGSYTYDYADLADVVKKTRGHLAWHGIVALTPLGSVGADLSCSVVLLHESGDEKEYGPFTFPHGRDAQATGSMVTYMRRYALVAALGMAAGDDDDGAAAQPRQPEFVWTVGATKARLVELLDGDKSAAKEAWTAGHGDDAEPGPELAERLAREWRDNQPKPESESVGADA